MKQYIEMASKRSNREAMKPKIFYLVVHQTPQVSGGLVLDVDVQTALSDVAF